MAGLTRRGKRPPEELYRITDDPDCVKNLASDPAQRRVKYQLREELEALLRADQDPRILGRGDVFDTYEYTGSRENSYDAWVKNQVNGR